MRDMSLDDRMKLYEKKFPGDGMLQPLCPWIIRLDGKAFHTYTRGLTKPFSWELHGMMCAVTKDLVQLTNASLAYTQSDEISLLLYTEERNSLLYFDGNVQKLQSILAAATVRSWAEHKYGHGFAPLMDKPLPLFDCRAFSVPNKAEAVNYFIWREQDAVRNSIQALGQAHFAHKSLHGKSCDEIQEMVFQQVQINWNNLPAAQKRGTYIRYVDLEQHSPQEPQRELVHLDWPRLTQITNREAVVFDNAAPETNANDNPEEAS
jgi:tRNA(His) guanylyltransferase